MTSRLDSTLAQQIYLLNPQNIEELRLFVVFLLSKQQTSGKSVPTSLAKDQASNLLLADIATRRQAILALAGSWKDLSDADFNDILRVSKAK